MAPMATSVRPRNLWQQGATMAMADALAEQGPPPLTERQDELTRRWRWYCATQYEHRAFHFDGTRRMNARMREEIAASGMMDVGQMQQRDVEALPWRYRHPSSPYHLARSITRRFTGLLFGADKHPTIECTDDLRTSEYAQGLVEAARLWPRMIEARDKGGAMGSCAMVFRFTGGRPIVGVLDPRWCFPTYRDRSTKELAALEYKFFYEEVSPSGRTRWFWYRRIITEQSDVVYEAKPVEDTTANWKERERVDHGLGFFPGVWIQNTHVEEHDDGEPDCVGIYDTLEEMDELVSASGVGAKAGCDPTVVLSSDMDLKSVRTGSKTAIKLGKGEDARYLEATGTGSERAWNQAMGLRRLALEVAQCVIEEPEESGDRTATEVDSRRSSMWDRASEYREQYGEMGAKPLVDKMVRAARMMQSGSLRSADGRILKAMVQVPAIVTRQGDRLVAQQRVPGEGTALALTWPLFNRPTPQIALTAAQAVAAARNTNPPSIDQATATGFLAPLFGGKDPEEMRTRAIAEAQAEQDASAQQLLEGMGAAPGGGEADGQSITLEEFEAGAFTIDEYRASRGFPALPDGAGNQTILRKKAPQASPIGAAPPTDQPLDGGAPAAAPAPTGSLTPTG